ncbi:ATP-binding protein [Neobacillus jeddahensis]|uniref:ATP-binding protein n=1 Tax=Neobacillus jeddahensis TaxID=1461580 RepID=UPI000693F944|nr:ATP-binding protein [Neobacillus jeddahensis]
MTYTGLYDIKLVILAFIVAIITSFATLKIITRIASAKAAEKKTWALAGSFIMALGIWTMHFIGMLSYNIHMLTRYNLELTIASFIIAFLGLACLFFTLVKEKPQMWRQALTVALMAIAMVGMHHLGMKSMETEDGFQYKTVLFFIAVIMALSVSAGIYFFAVYIINTTEKKIMKKILGSTFIGFCITSVHYMAIESVTFTGGPPQNHYVGDLTTIHQLTVSTNMLAYTLGLATIIIIVTIIALTYSERYGVEQKLRLTEHAYKQELDKVQQDVTNTLKRQQGLTLKYVKQGERYIHTFAEGALLYKLGLTPEKLVGKELRDVLPADQAARKLEAYRKAWAGEIADYEANLNGVDYYVILSPIIENGRVTEVIGSGVDVTNQKENEKQLHESHALRRTIIDNLPIAMIVVGHDRKVVALNRPFHDMFHLHGSIKDSIGQDALQYYDYYKDGAEEKRKVARIIEKQEPVVEEMELVDGRFVKRSYFPFFMDQELRGHLWTFEDITERKRMEEANRRAKEVAEQASDAKTRFLSHMSHELRTPLNSILGFSQLLELEETLTPKQAKFVKVIQNSGHHLLTLITDILDLSRIEAGKLKMCQELVIINPLIEECLQIVAPIAAKEAIEIRNDCQQQDDIVVSADPKRLKQILLNLLDNAIKYNRERGTVTVRAERRDGNLLVHIIDNGVGIPLVEQARIFEPFYRVGAVAKDGAGIGLPLALQLIQAMGGTMDVASKEGIGSDFWISLPLVTDTNVIAGDQREGRDQPSLQDANFTILYIEDNALNLQLVAEILGSIDGIGLLTEMKGRDGLAVATERQPDVILLDINLPDLNGMEVVARLKADSRTKAIPVVAVSANAMPEQIEHALAKGFADYVSKPIDVPAFLHVIMKYL